VSCCFPCIAVALALFLLLAAVGCAEEFQGRPPVRDSLHYPIAMAIDQKHGLLYVANSNFDLAHRAASVVTVNLKTNQYEEPFVAMGSFPGDFVLVDSKTAGGLFGYLTVRADNSLTWFAVKDGEGEEGAGDSPPVTLVCNSSGTGTDADCSGNHVVTDGEVVSEDDDSEPYDVDLGSDPYGVAFVPGSGEQPDHLAVGAMRSGDLTLLEITDVGEPVIVDQRKLLGGLHTIAVDPAQNVIYASNKSYPYLYRFGIEWDGELSTLDQLTSVKLPAPYSSAYFARGLAFANGGKYVLVAYRNPVSLLVVHGADETLEESQNTVHVVPLGSKPGNVRVFASGPGGKELAYVPCYGANTVWVVDLGALQPIAEIEVGEGPYDMVAILSQEMKRGYVSNFLDHSVSVIDLDPDSPYYHTRIAEIH